MNNFGNYRSGYGRSMQIGPGSISPFIKYIIIINVAVFLMQQIFGARFDFFFGLAPQLFFGQFPNYTYQIITYMFLHGGLWHLLFNMFALWMFGTEIEYTWRTKPFARFYIIGGLLAAILSLMTNSLFPAGLIIGASGAIYAVLVAYWLMFPERQLFIFGIIPAKVKWAIPGFMLLGFLMGGGNVAHMAHLGGALWGFIYLKLDWRWLRFGQKLKSMKYKRQSQKMDKNRQQAEDIMKRVDSILDKINEVGIDNISKEDREFLDRASSELSHKKDQTRRR